MFDLFVEYERGAHPDHHEFRQKSNEEALYLAQIIVATTIGIVVIILSYQAYRRTKCLGFALWIVSSVLSLSATIGWDVIGHAYPYPRIYPAAVIAYRSVYLVNSVVPAVGTVLVIREFMRVFRSQRM